MRTRLGAVVLGLTLLVLPALAQEVPRSPTPKPVALAAKITDVAVGLEHPWGVELLPDGRFLVTERPGRLRLIGRDGKLSEPLTGVPEAYARGQGGLLDVALSPGFAQDRLVYLSFAERGDGGAGTAVARGRLGERGLEGTQVIWRQQPKVEGAYSHWGSRIVFRRRHTLRHGATATPIATRPGSLAYHRQVVAPQPVRLRAARHPSRARRGCRDWSYGHRHVQSRRRCLGERWTV